MVDFKYAKLTHDLAAKYNILDINLQIMPYLKGNSYPFHQQAGIKSNYLLFGQANFIARSYDIII